MATEVTVQMPASPDHSVTIDGQTIPVSAEIATYFIETATKVAETGKPETITLTDGDREGATVIFLKPTSSVIVRTHPSALPPVVDSKE